MSKKTIEMTYKKLEGEIFFKSQIKSTLLDSSKKPVRILRLIIIEHKGSYKIVVQYRAGIINYSKADIDNDDYLLGSLSLEASTLYCSDNEESNWFVDKVIDCSDVDALITNFKNLLGDMINEKNLLVFKSRNTRLFNFEIINPLKFAFYQKLMRSGLQSDHLPF